MSDPASEPSRSAAGEFGTTILVVEDNETTRRLVVRLLDRFGWREVLEADDGVAAQEILKTHDVAVVITDVMMPKLDGLGLMQWASDHAIAPIWIILSGLGTFDAAVDAIRLGAFDFLPKPFQSEQLRVAVRNALEHARLLRAEQQLKEDLHRSNERLRDNVRELEQACQTLEEQREVIRRDLARAEVIQRSLLPHEPSLSEGVCVDAIYRPGRHVGGDLYDVWRVDENHVALYVADASGHGVTAAMLSVLFKQRLRPTLGGGAIPPAEVLSQVNRALIRDISAPGMFLTAAYCVFDTGSGSLSIASAGHPPVLLKHADGEVDWVERTGPALGLTADAVYEQKELRFSAGDRLLIYSDGLLEGIDKASAGAERALLAATEGADAMRGLLAASAAVETDDRDDVTMVLLQSRQGRSTFDNGETHAGESAAAPSTYPRPSRVFYGETDDGTFLSVHGHGTWMDADVFLDSSRASLDAGRSLVVDLAECGYLDSTFLGTIHEVVSRSNDNGARVRLQAVPPVVRHLFEELAMRAVLEHIADANAALPATMRPLGTEPPRQEHLHMRMLRAHELLASLSEGNREQFESVVQSLRRELGPGD